MADNAVALGGHRFLGLVHREIVGGNQRSIVPRLAQLVFVAKLVLVGQEVYYDCHRGNQCGKDGDDIFGSKLSPKSSSVHSSVEMCGLLRRRYNKESNGATESAKNVRILCLERAWIIQSRKKGRK